MDRRGVGRQKRWQIERQTHAQGDKTGNRDAENKSCRKQRDGAAYEREREKIK